MAETKEKEVKQFELVQIPTQHELAISTPDGEILTLHQALVKALNLLYEVDKRV